MSKATDELALSRPEHLKKMNGRWVSTIGFSHYYLMYHLLSEHYGRAGREDCTPECAAHFCYAGDDSEDNCAMIRWHMGGLHRKMLEFGYFLAPDYSGKHGKITSFRVITKSDRADVHQLALPKIERTLKLTRTNRTTFQDGAAIVTKLRLTPSVQLLLDDLKLRLSNGSARAKAIKNMGEK